MHKINTLVKQMYSQSTEIKRRRPYFITEKHAKQKSESTLLSTDRCKRISTAQSFNETSVISGHRGRIVISIGLEMTRRAMQVFSQTAGAPISTTTTWVHPKYHGNIVSNFFFFFFFLWRCDPTRVMTSSFLRFLDHTTTHHSR